MKRVLPLLILVLASFTGAQQHQRRQPTSTGDDHCSKFCGGVGGDVHYEVGKSYTYDLSSTTNLIVPKIGQRAAVIQRARVHINVVSPCEFSLSLEGVSLNGLDVGREWSQVLEQHHLRFGFSDGEVQAICPDSSDPTWSVNVKRAVLSMFQSVLDSKWETDISGECSVERKIRRHDSSIHIEKSKNITSCRRASDVAGIRNIPYMIHSKLQSAPIMRSTQTCSQEIRNSILTKSTCKEKHEIPSAFDDGEAVTATVDATLTYTGTSQARGAKMLPFKQRQSLAYDGSAPHPHPKDSLNAARRDVAVLCGHKGSVQSEAASHFMDLVIHLRGLTQREISSLSPTHCTAFTNALSACGTSECFGQLATLINSGQAPESIYSSFVMLTDPKPGVIQHVAEFISRVPVQGLLGVSSLLQSYCLTDPQCGTESNVQRIMHDIVNRLPRGCEARDSGSAEQAVTILKAIGNVAHEEISMKVLQDCIQKQPRRYSEIRLAAIDALRRKECTDHRNTQIEKIFFDRKNDVELRIVAFQQLIKCPTPELVDKIADDLKNETTNQVGSYVWSYLNAKRISTNPDNAELQRLLKREYLSDFFRLDPRRFSRFSELGYMDEETNVGGHMDMNVIVEPKFYLPRQVSANFTVHLFGKSINLLEVGARIVNADGTEEELFGADGYVTNPNGHTFRERIPSRDPKFNQLSSEFLRKQQPPLTHFEGSTYMRLFGDDICYSAYETDNLFATVRKYIDINKILDESAREKQYDFERSILLADITKSIPTISGLPIEYKINSSMVAKLANKHKINLVDLLHQRGNFEIMVDSHPSASVAVGVSLTLRANDVASGMQFSGSLYSAASVNTRIELKDGRIFNVKIEVPEEKIIAAQLQSVSQAIDNNRMMPLDRRVQKTHKQHCTGDEFGKISGLKSCLGVENQFPSTKVDFSLTKWDPQLQFYEFIIEGKYTETEKKLHISLDTPRSRINRKMEVGFDMDMRRRKLDIKMITPFKKIIVDGDLTERVRQRNYEAKLKMTVDDRQTYNMDGTLDMTDDRGHHKYTLKGKTIAGSSANAELSTDVEYDTARPYARIDFNLGKVFAKPVIFKALFGLHTPKYEANIEYDGVGGSGKLGASLDVKGLGGKGSVHGEYQFGHEPKKSFLLEGEQSFTKKGPDHSLKNSGKIEAIPLFKYEYELISTSHGGDMKNSLKVIRDAHQALFNVDIHKGRDNLYTANAVAKCPYFGLDHKADITYQNKFPSQFLLKVLGKTPRLHDLKGHAEYSIRVDPKWGLDAKLEMSYPGKHLLITNKVDETAKRKYKVNTVAEWNVQNRLSADSEVVYRPKVAEYTLESDIRVSGVPDPIHIRKHLQYGKGSYSIEMEARKGREVIYEMKGGCQGDPGQRQMINLNIRSDKIGGRQPLNYQLKANVEPRGDAFDIDAEVTQHGRKVGSAKIHAPKSYRSPSINYRADLNWEYERKPHKATVDYRRSPAPEGSAHIVHIESDGRMKFDGVLDTGRKVHLKSNLMLDGRKTSAVEIEAGPLRFNHFDIGLTMETDAPLQRRHVKGKAAMQYQPNQYDMEGWLEHNGQRFLGVAKWKKDQRGADRHYIYSGKLETPQTHYDMEQQVSVGDVFTIRRCETELNMRLGPKQYKLKHNMKNDEGHYITDLSFKGDGHVGSQKWDITHRAGQRHIKLENKWDEKFITALIDTAYVPNRVKVDIDVETSQPQLRKLKSDFECNKGTAFWNCNYAGNVNDRYILDGSEELAPEKTNLKYKAVIPRMVQSEGEFGFIFDKRAERYAAKAQLKNFDKEYVLDLKADRQSGDVKIKAPFGTISDTKVRVMKRGHDSYEITSEQGRGSRVHILMNTGEQNQKFDMTVTETQQPFKFLFENTATGGKQKSAVELTLDPVGHTKRTYGIENELETQGGLFRGLKTTLKHPKKNMQIDVRRPSQNQYTISYQPHVGSNRLPTTAEMSVDRRPNHFLWKGTFTDPALQSPIKVLIEGTRTGTDEFNYGVELKSEFDYSGQPNKIMRKSLKITRSQQPPHGQAQEVKFDSEFKATANGIDISAHANVHRKLIGEMLLPLDVEIALTSKDMRGRPVTYGVNMNSDAASFTEVKATTPTRVLRARADRIGDNHLKLAFFKDGARPTTTGEIRYDKHGIEIQLKDETTGDVNVHASALMPNDYNAEIEVWHTEHRRKVMDARLSADIDDENMLTLSAYARPEIREDIKKKAKETASDVANPRVNTLVKDVILPVAIAHKNNLNDVRATLHKFISELANEHRDFAKDFGPDYEALVDHAKEQYELLEESVALVYDTIHQMFENMAEAASGSTIAHQFRGGHLGRDLSRSFAEAMRPISDFFNTLSRQSDETLRELRSSIRSLEHTLKIDELRASYQDFMRKFDQLDIIHDILQWLRVKSRAYNLPDVERAVHDIERNRHLYESKVQKMWRGLKDVMLDKMFVSILTSGTTGILDPLATEPLDDAKIRFAWYNVVQYLRGHTTIEQLSRTLWEKYIPRIDRKPDGEISVVIALPVRVSLVELVDLAHPNRLIAMGEDAFDDITSLLTSHPYKGHIDSIHTFKRHSFHPMQFSGPFESIGYVVYSEYFITFDGVVYRIEDGCDAILAGDLVNKKFVISASFDRSHRPSLNSIKLEFRGEEYVLYKDGRVMLQRSDHGLPWQQVDSMDGTALVSVVRDEDWTTLKTYDGIKVSCNRKRDICAIVVPPRMYGKSDGMLGSNDNEPENDFVFHESHGHRQGVIDIGKYSIRGGCRSGSTLSEYKKNDDCDAIFDSTFSPLRRCFGQVNAFPILKLCGASGDTCLASSTYVFACSHAHTSIDLPEKCYECADALKVGEEKEVNHPVQGHDVVFVVEERKCMQEAKDKIAEVARGIASQQRDVSFGWIGFGGEGAHNEPHLQYERASARLDMNSIMQIVRSHSFEPASGIESPNICPLKAVKYAIEHYPFRLAVSKSIILVECSSCDTASHPSSDVSNELEAQGIKMHILTTHKLETTTEKKTAVIDVETRKSLKSPSNVCTNTALDSSGAIFNLKHGTQAAARKIQPRGSNNCNKCYCEVDGLSTHNICQPCESSEHASRRIPSRHHHERGPLSDEIRLDAAFF